MSKARNIIVTGASRGLGLAMATEFARLGHVVAGCGRSRPTSPPPAKVGFTQLDVTDDAAVGRWARELLSLQGPPDLLVNNAAIINRNAPLWEIDAAEFSRVVDVNLKGVANVIRHFVPAMILEGRGVIVNFSSGWGRSTSPEVAPYCATKWGIEGLTKALAEELPSGLAAIPLNPGVINTEMLRSCFGESAESYPDATAWAEVAVPFILGLNHRHNGQSLSVPL